MERECILCGDVFVTELWSDEVCDDCEEREVRAFLRDVRQGREVLPQTESI